MKGLTLTGKRKSSIDILKKVLFNIVDYNPTIILDESNDLNFMCYLYISYKVEYDLIDIIRILINHCSSFKLEIDDDMYYDNTTSPYYMVTEYYKWDGKDLKKCYKDYFGSTCEIVNYLLK